MKVQKWNCKVCGVSFPQKYLEKFKYICPWCQNKETPIVLESIIPEINSEDVIDFTIDFKWVKLYTQNYLNKKLCIDFNSIKKQIACVRYKNKYILKKDLLNILITNLNKYE